MHVCSGLLRAYPIEVVTTQIRAIVQCIPQFLPFFTPLEGSLTYQANLGQVLTLRNQTLMNRASQQRDAVPNRLTVKVLAGYADP